MKNKLYVFYNTLSCRYGNVVSFPSDALASRDVATALKDSPDKDVLELCRIGDIDIETGIADVYAPVRVHVPLDPISVVPIDNIEKSM